MNFLNLALRRRSIRKYTAQEIENDKLERILQAALSSPSSKHLNPWELVEVKDKATLEKLSEVKTYGSSMLRGANVGVVVCVDSALTDTWQCDGAIVAHNMLLCAEDEGLGGCWVQIAGREESEKLVHELLEIPQQMAVLCIVSLGYKAEEKKMINIDKLQYEKIHYERY